MKTTNLKWRFITSALDYRDTWNTKNKDIRFASVYGMLAASLGGILLGKTGRMTYEELNDDNNEFDK